MLKKFLVLFLAAFMAVGMASVASAAPVLSFEFDIDKDITIPNVGDSVTVALYALVLDDGGSPGTEYELQSFGFDLEYNAALLNITAASVDSQWWFGTPKADFSTDGLLEMAGAYMNFLPPPYGIGSPMLLGSISFECEALGLSTLTIFDEDRGGTYADFALAHPFAGDDLDDQITLGLEIGSINNVPIPGAILLLGSGLLGLVGIKRRFRG